jgi:hypothetical protein
MYFHFNSCRISVCSRICNKVIVWLLMVRVLLPLALMHVFMSQAPSFVSELVSRDKYGVGC